MGGLGLILLSLATALAQEQTDHQSSVSLPKRSSLKKKEFRIKLKV